MPLFDKTLCTCRFCKKTSFDSEGMVKYGVRHYACYDCYLDAGKTLNALHSWQVGEFPCRVLKDRGLLDQAAQMIDGAA